MLLVRPELLWFDTLSLKMLSGSSLCENRNSKKWLPALPLGNGAFRSNANRPQKVSLTSIPSGTPPEAVGSELVTVPQNSKTATLSSFFQR